jgi:hypothetical protein
MSYDWKFVKVLEFVRYDDHMQLQEIVCKVCGTVIAGMSEEVVKRGQNRNGETVVTMQRRFLRHHNYSEIKIQFTNNSFHVTNGCRNCLSESLTPDQLQELYWADVLRDPQSFTDNDRKRVAARVAALMRGAGGLS